MLKKKVIIFTLLAFFSLDFVYAQAKDKTAAAAPKKAATEEVEEKPADYLELVHYTRKAEKLKDQSLRDIHFLSILVKNFGGDVSGSKEQLDTIKDNYKESLRLYYRRKGFASGKKMVELRAKIRDLYQKFSNHYETKADELLTQCADAIVTILQNQEMNNADSEKSRLVQQNEHKLRIAYFQMGMAERSNRDAMYDQALVHYRLAKAYGIHVLANLQSTEEEKKQIESKYRVDLLDNKNLIADSSTPAAK